jgi:hypothetical protein
MEADVHRRGPVHLVIGRVVLRQRRRALVVHVDKLAL